MCWVICAGQHAAGRGFAPGEGRSELECFGTHRRPLTMTAAEPQSTAGQRVDDSRWKNV